MKASKKKADEEAYLSPEKAEEARQEGNELFKGGKYPEAIAKYSDAMKRNPKNHVPYSNRAACYQKLGEWQARRDRRRRRYRCCGRGGCSCYCCRAVAVGAQGRRKVRRDGPYLHQGMEPQGDHPPVPEGVPQGAK